MYRASREWWWWRWWWCAAMASVSARELDPAACAARFDVQRDKIIRTEESREMGARYLSELDVGARAECLRLCCETDACDVFVFEEKSPGSCYLFNCGPPEDFRCKFTAHGNFSSGVLALSRRLAELQDQQRLVHHERELASLRSGATTSTPASSTTTARTTTPPPPVAAPATPPPSPPPRLLELQLPMRCSRYQFECRRGGECIAVYNACDGVPQCADGSDEAPELACPPAPTPPRPPPAPPARPPLSQLEERGGEATGALWPHRLAQAQPRWHSDGGGSHIFSHTGGLLQEAEERAWAPRAWAPAPPPVAPAPLLPLGPGAEAEHWSAWDTAPRRAWPAPMPELPPYETKTMPELPLEYPGPQAALQDQPKKGAPPARPATVAREPTTSPPLLSVEGHKASSASPEAEAARHSWAGELRTADALDGLSERPPAAVLLLVLGSLLTAALGALLLSRARAARRRRARPRLALDADYLVNGMYL